MKANERLKLRYFLSLRCCYYCYLRHLQVFCVSVNAKVFQILLSIFASDGMDVKIIKIEVDNDTDRNKDDLRVLKAL